MNDNPSQVKNDPLQINNNNTQVYLELENGLKLNGNVFGHKGCCTGELVFQTGLTGYPESMTDPSYAGQILVFTYPLIGNYGFPRINLDEWGLDKNTESEKVAIKAIIVSEYTGNYSHWEADRSLEEWMIEHRIIGLSGIDTRYLTKIIRESGVCRARIINNDTLCYFPDFITIGEQDLVSQVTCDKVIHYSNTGSNTGSNTYSNISPKIIFYDCGAKNSQLRGLLERGFDITKVPHNYVDVNLTDYDGIFISNGPGDPTMCKDLIALIKRIIDENIAIPIFGICLGHQLLGLAAGYPTIKMKYGNRGHNIPVKMTITNQPNCLITSQNHGYCLDDCEENTPSEWITICSNANDNSNEGICHKKMPYYSVQFHPEARGGPTDANFLFDVFKEMIETKKHPLDIIKNHFTETVGNISDQQPNNENKKVIILGSGGLSIGQAGEFDYSGSQAIKAYKEMGLEVILINPNIATIQTSKGLADRIYYLPITSNFVSQVIEQERPDYISVSFGGQTSLNCGMDLFNKGILARFGVKVLGTNITSVKISEDRDMFKQSLKQIKLKVPPSDIAKSVEEAIKVVEKIGFPVLVRAGFCLGGQGSGFANNQNELSELVEKALQISETVIIDKSLKGWKELEYEIVRDRYDNCISVCNMENLDPLGVHTGESIVVAPSQTLSDIEYQKLRSVCFQIVRHLQIIGECNVQFAINPNSFEFYIIEMNARLSRSSALASKATGYPLAYIAAKISLGYSLLELTNKVTGNTTACFEPSLDYVVVKIPRWDLTKFPRVSRAIGSHMKSVGEVMAIGRSFTEAIQKAIRMVGDYGIGFIPTEVNILNTEIDKYIKPNSRRLVELFSLLYNNSLNIYDINIKTGIDKWFLYQINRLVIFQHIMEEYKNNHQIFFKKELKNAKQLGFSDSQIANAIKTTETIIRQKRYELGINPVVKQIDTVAGEFPCSTNYLFLTYNGVENDLIQNSKNNTNLYVDNKKNNDIKNIIVLGSGVYRIGSSVEFDWCSVSCIRELRNNEIRTIMINNNPETVSTDYDEADKLYFEELTLETVLSIYKLEESDGVILSMGGQVPNNIAMSLYRQNVKILGTSPEMIDMAENRYKFSRLLDKILIDQPRWKELTNLEEAKSFCQQVGYPCLVRPSYVLSGAAMNVAYKEHDLSNYLADAKEVSPDHPVVISKFISNAKEIEVDAVANQGNVVILAISEHIENAGIHSGDATLVLPAQDLTKPTIGRIKEITRKIASNLNISGPFNLQLIAKDDKLKVIECNLRVSRSFPFASKTLDIDMIKLATRIMIDKSIEVPSKIKFDRVGVKVPQFSFHRLENADVILGVEMSSTGEVAGFGCNRNIAFMKAIMATGFKIPAPGNTNVFISIGSYRHKEEFINSIKIMIDMGWTIYGTFGTSDFYQEHGFNVSPLLDDDITSYIKNHKFDLVINIPVPQKVYTQNLKITLGYSIRRLCLDFKVSLLIDIKCAKLLIESIYYFYHKGQILDEWFDVQGNVKEKESISKLQMLPSVMENSLSCVSVNEINLSDTPIRKTEVVFKDHHIISVNQFNRNLLRQLFLRTQEIRNMIEDDKSIKFQKQYQLNYVNKILNGKTIGLIFYEASTRTRCSFETAIKMLGGNVIDANVVGSSVKKGESLEDFVRCMECYCDALVIRTNEIGMIERAIRVASKPIINAGDGCGEHPTQALLDVFTIREERGTVNGIKIGIVGDLLNGRTVHSLVPLLTNYNVHFYFVSPSELQMPKNIIDFLKIIKDTNLNNVNETTIDWEIAYSIEDIIPIVDVLYMTRLQKERFVTLEGIVEEINWSYYAINPFNIINAKSNLVIMHPLPRNDEISVELDSDPRSAYFRQMKYGLYVRMALLEMLLC